MNCRNIQALSMVRLLTETVWQYSFFYQIEDANFSLFCKISMNTTVEFDNICFFKDMDFNGHEFSEPFQTVALGLLSYLVVWIINHMITFLLYFPCPTSFFMALKGSFLKFTVKKQRDGIYILLRSKFQEPRCFGVIFRVF